MTKMTQGICWKKFGHHFVYTLYKYTMGQVTWSSHNFFLYNLSYLFRFYLNLLKVSNIFVLKITLKFYNICWPNATLSLPRYIQIRNYLIQFLYKPKKFSIFPCNIVSRFFLSSICP